MTDRLCNRSVAVFAVWTLLANAVVWRGGGLRDLVGLAALVCAAAAAHAWRRRRRAAVPVPASLPAEALAPTPGPALGVRAAAAAAAALCVAGWAGTGEVVVYWAGALALSAALSLREFRGPLSVDCAVPSRAAGRALLALAFGCAALPLFLHRPDADDAFYVNLAVAAADHPGAALIAHDTLHGVPGALIPLPIYKVHSLELLEAALAYLTPLRVLDVAHVAIPAFAAFLVPLVYARLFRRLLPQRWLWATLAAVGFLVAVGTPHQGFGNFSFVRLHQGKAILLSLMLPMVLASALEYALAPSRARWLRLAAAQIAAVGVSASALWCAPVVAAIGLASATPLRRPSLRAFALGLLASSYVLFLGIALSGATSAAFARALPEWRAQASASYALAQVLGTGSVAWVQLFALAGAWALAPAPLLRRLCLCSALVFLVGFWNPFSAGWVGAHVTGLPTYWRVFWLLPMPLLVATLLSAPLEVDRRSRLVAALGFAASGAWLSLAPAAYTGSAANLVHIGAPGWKLPPSFGRAAQQIARAAPEGATVLAPPAVARWIPMLHQHPTPLVVRELYLEGLREQLGDAEIARRLALSRLVSGRRRDSDSGALLSRAIRDIPLSAVCLTGPALRWPELRRALEASDLQLLARESGYEIWASP